VVTDLFMKLFKERQLKEAYEHAKNGGQALHLFSDPGVYPGCPNYFKRSREAAHLFDYNIGRLITTARRLGVRVIKVGRKGQRGQHIDLCGSPLIRAKEEVTQGLI
jgi:hypothetical protein